MVEPECTAARQRSCKRSDDCAPSSLTMTARQGRGACFTAIDGSVQQLSWLHELIFNGRRDTQSPTFDEMKRSMMTRSTIAIAASAARPSNRSSDRLCASFGFACSYRFKPEQGLRRPE